MNKFIKKVCAVSACALMLFAGCSNNGGAPDKTRPTEYRLIQSKEAGNSGEVTLQPGDTYAVISIRDYGDITLKLYPDLAPYAVYNFTELAKAGKYNGTYFHRIVEDFMAQGGSATNTGAGGDSFEGGTFRSEVNTCLRHYYGALCMGSAAGDLTDQFYIVNNKYSQTSLADLYAQNVEGSKQQAEVMNMYLQMLDTNDETQKAYYNAYSKQKQFYIEYSKGAQAMLDTLTDKVTATYEQRGGYPHLDGGYTVFGQTVEGFDVLDAVSACEKVDDGRGNISKPAVDVIIDKIEIFTK